MSDEVNVVKTLDLKGLACPMPVVKVSKGIKEIEVGEVLQAVTTDPGALTDFPAWANTTGNEIINQGVHDNPVFGALQPGCLARSDHLGPHARFLQSVYDQPGRGPFADR